MQKRVSTKVTYSKHSVIIVNSGVMALLEIMMQSREKRMVDGKEQQKEKHSLKLINNFTRLNLVIYPWTG